MLETIDDFISLGVIVFLFLAATKLFLASLRNPDSKAHRRSMYLQDYADNEDE